MEIIWHGESCFSLKSSDITVVTDPYESGIGIKLPNLAANVVTVSNRRRGHSNAKDIEGNPKVLDWPGEYEVRGIPFMAIESFHNPKSKGTEKKNEENDNEDREKAITQEKLETQGKEEEQGKSEKRGENLIFLFEMEGMKICHLGDLGHTLTNEINEAIGDVDILMVPIGGNLTIDHKKAHEVIEQIDPRMVIPMHYGIPGLKAEIADIQPFLKEIGQLAIEPVNKLKIKKTELPEDKTNFVVLAPVTG